MVFKIQPHNRLQEWVAEEKGYFEDEGLEYVFHVGDNVVRHYSYRGTPANGDAHGGGVQSTEEAPGQVTAARSRRWRPAAPATSAPPATGPSTWPPPAEHGKMWGHAYSVTPAGIYVAPESPIRPPGGPGRRRGRRRLPLRQPLLGAPGAGGVPQPGSDEIWRSSAARTTASRSSWTARSTPPTSSGCRPTSWSSRASARSWTPSFMIGFLISGQDTDIEDVEKYFRALRRAQRDIDVEHQQYTHYYLREMADEFKGLVDVRAFGPASAWSSSRTPARCTSRPTAGWRSTGSSARTRPARSASRAPSSCMRTGRISCAEPPPLPPLLPPSSFARSWRPSPRRRAAARTAAAI